jgi:hypothetical protein
MYNTYTKRQIIQEDFYIKSKIISINVLRLQGCPPSKERVAKGSRTVEAIERFCENELPAFVALASTAPNVLAGLHSDVIQNRIKLINQQLDQQFGTSADSFAERKEVIERVSLFRQMRAAGLVLIGTGDEVLKNILNHPDSLTGPVIRAIRPLMNGEVEKYNFTSDDAIDLHNSVFALQNQIFQEFTINRFLFAADVGDHISMREARAANGADCSRKHSPNVSGEFRRPENQRAMIAEELEALFLTSQIMAAQDCAPIGGAHAGVGYDRHVGGMGF